MERSNALLTLFTAGSLVLSWTSCNNAPAPAAASPPMDMTAVTAEIQAMEDAYAAASKAKDADAVVAYYAEDVVSYSDEKEPVQGKAAMRARLAERMAKDTTHATPTYKVMEVFMGTDHLTEIGSWTDTDSTGAVVDFGTYFSVFRKKSDGWECIRDISVSSKPKEEATAQAAP